MQKDNKVFIVLLGIIILIAIVCVFYAFQNNNEVMPKTDAIKMQEEYSELNGEIAEYNQMQYPTVNLKDDNPFVYKSEEEIVDVLSNKSGVIYFGFPSCPWCRNMLPVLEEVLIEENIKEAYYLNISDIRDTYSLDENDKLIKEKDGSANYYKILELLDKYLDEYVLTSESGKKVSTKVKRLYAPTVVVVKNGEIKGIHVGTVDSQENAFEALTEDETKSLKETYKKLVATLQDGICQENC